MATPIQVPPLGESITQAILLKWHKSDGQSVSIDEPICDLETDKANVEIPSPAAGTLRRVKNEGDTVAVGEVIAQVNASVGDSSPAPAAVPTPTPAVVPASTTDTTEAPSPIVPTDPGERIANEGASATAVPTTSSSLPPMDFDAQGIRRVPMSKIRKRIAERLVSAQHTAAILTTFNEIDMTAILGLRAKYKDRFTEIHGVSLGLMSFFVRGCVLALREFPRLNAYLDRDEIVYHNYVHLGIAVSTDRGLAVPVLRNIQTMSFGQIESEIKRLAQSTREGRLSIEELSGGTFTITNGGIFGSMLSTPILTPPESGILGLHAIQKRPVVIDDKIEIRPMMYVALSYDHRLVDGRESVTFLVRLKQLLEDPARLMLEI